MKCFLRSVLTHYSTLAIYTLNWKYHVNIEQNYITKFKVYDEKMDIKSYLKISAGTL